MNRTLISLGLAALLSSAVCLAQGQPPQDPSRQPLPSDPVPTPTPPTQQDEGDLPPDMVRDPVQAAPQEPANTRDTVAGQPSTVDQAFLDEALHKGQQEVEAARLAKTRTGNDDVRSLAGMIEADHLELNERLAAAGARSSGMPGGTAAQGGDLDRAEASSGSVDNKADSGHLASLRSAQGEEFDRAYLRMQVSNHEASIRKFEQAAAGEGGHGQAAKSVAQLALPLLRRHKQEASALLASLDEGR